MSLVYRKKMTVNPNLTVDNGVPHKIIDRIDLENFASEAYGLQNIFEFSFVLWFRKPNSGSLSDYYFVNFTMSINLDPAIQQYNVGSTQWFVFLSNGSPDYNSYVYCQLYANKSNEIWVEFKTQNVPGSSVVLERVDTYINGLVNK